MVVPLILALLVFSVNADLPPEWKPCSQSASDFKSCISTQMETAIASLKDGNRKFQIISMDPLKFNNLHINQGHGPVAIDLLFPEVALTGFADNINITVHSNDWKSIKGAAFVKLAHLKGKYKIDGKVMVLPVKGEGDVDLEFDDSTVGFEIKLREIEKNKNKVFDVTYFHADLEPQGMKLNFQNLFNGDKALGDNMNEFLNVNWKEVMAELKPALFKGISEIFSKITNLILHKIPVEQIVIP